MNPQLLTRSTFLSGSLALAGVLAGCAALPPATTSVRQVESRRTPGGAFSWPEGLGAGKALTPEQCVAVALWNSPDYQSALADLGIARSEAVKAGQVANPSLALLFPSDAKAFEAALKLPVEALWLRPKRIALAQTDLEATAARLMQAGADLARDTRLAASRVLLVREQAEFAGENGKGFDEMARIAETREKAGEHGGLELSQARADAAMAGQEKERLKYEERLAMEKLRSLMGMAQQTGSLELKAGSSAAPSDEVGPAIQEAIRSRADVRAAELGVIAAGQRAGLAKAEVFNLSAAAKFTDGAGTQPGFDLPLPVFHQNQAARVLADAQLEKAMRQLAAARHRAAADTRESIARMNQARAVATGWDKVLPELETALEKARKAVAEGEAQPLLALDAARRLADARSKAADGRFRLAEALAELRRALGKT